MSPADKLQQLIREIEQADSFLDQVPIFRQAGPWIKQHWPSFYQDYQSLERQASSSAELMFLNASALATVGSSVPIVLSNQHMEDEMIAFLTTLVEVAEPHPDTPKPARMEGDGPAVYREPREETKWYDEWCRKHLQGEISRQELTDRWREWYREIYPEIGDDPDTGPLRSALSKRRKEWSEQQE